VGQGVNQPVVVQVSGVASNALNFTYDAPQITGISPATDNTQGGAVMTISGSNFGTAGTVTVGGVVCAPTGTAFAHSTIQCSVPPGSVRQSVARFDFVAASALRCVGLPCVALACALRCRWLVRLSHTSLSFASL
jgi:hypothetical protein